MEADVSGDADPIIILRMENCMSHYVVFVNSIKATAVNSFESFRRIQLTRV